MHIDDVTTIIERFADAGFTVPEIIALLVSHTIAAVVRFFFLFFAFLKNINTLKSLIGQSRSGK